MRTRTLLSTLLLTAFFQFAAATNKYTIVTSGNSFTPADLNATLGDTVVFEVETGHTATEVEQATWNSNGSTAKAGGFNFTNPGGYIILENVGTIYYVCVPHASIGMKGKINVSQFTSYKKIKLSNAPFTIYPNPATTEVTIAFENNRSNNFIRVTFFDITGKQVLTKESNNLSTGIASISFNIAELPKGVYLLEIYADTRKIVKRLTITE